MFMTLSESGLQGRDSTSRARIRAWRGVDVARPLLLLSALLASASGCDTGSPPTAGANFGSVSLALALSPTITVNAVDYTVSGNGITPIAGEIDVSGAGATVSAVIGDVPAGNGYQVELKAQSIDGSTTCDGKSSVDVAAGQTSSVTVVVQCRGPVTGGQIAVSGKFNNCPSITSFTGSPITVSVGGSILVTATAMDPDFDTLTYAWMASLGTFTNPTTAGTTFTCKTAGTTSLTVTVSDGMCADMATLPITCVPFCSVRPNGTPCDDGSACTRTDVCQAGACVGSDPVICQPSDQCHVAGACDPGTGACSSPVAPDGKMCMLPNSTAACATATCGIVSCLPGFADCNVQPGDGCEVSIDTSPANCGRCGRTCPTGSTCAAGLCVSAPPANVAVRAGGWRVGVSWSAAPGATSYQVFRAPMGSSTFSNIGTTTATQFYDESVATGVAYAYGLTSVSEGGVSALTSTVTVTPSPKQLCVSSDSMHAVLVFDETQSGTVSPVRAISGASTGFGFPKAVATSLDDGELFVSLLGGDVAVFPFDASGNVAPTRLLTGASLGSAFNLLALDPRAHEIFTADFNAGGAVDVVDSATGALKRTIAGAATQIGKPESAIVDESHGELLVGQLDPTGTFQQIQVFQKAAVGNSAPLRTLGSSSSPAGGFSLAYDPGHDEIYATCNCNNRVDVYPRTAAGGAAPSRSITVSPLLSVYSILLDSGDDSLWLFGSAGFGMYQLWEVPRGSSGAVMPSHAPPAIAANGGRLAPCD